MPKFNGIHANTLPNLNVTENVVRMHLIEQIYFNESLVGIMENPYISMLFKATCTCNIMYF